MFAWPRPELTDYEREHVRIYRTKNKPGILKRVYTVELRSIADADAGFPVAVFTGRVQISRRSRVFGLSFVGDTYSWRLGILTSAGTTFTNQEPTTGLSPLVQAMAPGSFYNAGAFIGEPPVTAFEDVNNVQMRFRSQRTLLKAIDPNWLLMPNETLNFEGALTAPLDPATDARLLSIGVHVWEFPGMITGGE